MSKEKKGGATEGRDSGARRLVSGTARSPDSRELAAGEGPGLARAARRQVTAREYRRRLNARADSADNSRVAKVLGESGKYVSAAADRKRRQFALVSFSAIGLVGLVEGFVLGSIFQPVSLSLWAKATIQFAGILTLFALWKWGDRTLDEIDKKRSDFQRGADGEHIVARTLSRLPDSFYVVHDLATPYGNLDHVVIGPTGVFILDAKSWRGTVSSDGRGELLLNGQPTEKPHVRIFVGRMLGIRDKIRALVSPTLDPYYQAVFVFTSARVDAKWGSTGRVHCVRDDQLYDYIVDPKFGKRLEPRDAEAFAQAFRALAHMESDFAGRNELDPKHGAIPTPAAALAASR